MKTTVTKAPAKKPLLEITPTAAQLREANHQASLTKAKARQAKAAFKNAKKAFKLARKAAKAARKEADTLQEAITKAAQKVAAVKKAGAARPASRKKTPQAAPSPKPVPPIKRKRVRKTSVTASSPLPDAAISPVAEVSNSAEALDGSTPATAA